MSKLKDYNIPGWPEKKGLCCAEEFNILSNEAYALKTENNILHDKLLNLIENLEFFPAELVEFNLDETIEIVQKAFYDNGYGATPTVCPECRADDFSHVEGCSRIGKELDIVIAQAIIDNKKNILK